MIDVERFQERIREALVRLEAGVAEARDWYWARVEVTAAQYLEQRERLLEALALEKCVLPSDLRRRAREMEESDDGRTD